MTEAERLEAIIRADAWLWGLLETARAVDAPDWLIGAGVLRTRVWDALYRVPVPTPIADVDLVFFDPADLSPERDAAVTADLCRAQPGIAWEATNQAAVHLWYADYFDHAVPPLESSADGVGTWPETATSVAVCLLPGDRLHIVAPCGLGDLLGGILRRNPRRVSASVFAARIKSKRIHEYWPQVQIVAE